MKWPLVLVAAAVWLSLVGLAHAQLYNFRPYIVGERAAGMGGAFTALASDGSGPYYNPAGIGFARKNSLSLTASIYGFARGSIANVLGPGQGFVYSGLNTFPVSASAVFKFGHRLEADGTEGPAPHAIALSLFIPDALLIDDRTTIGGQTQNTFFLSSEVQTIWAGATYAYRTGRLSLGASGFLLFGMARDFFDITYVATQRDFAGITLRGDETVYGIVGAAGAHVDVTDHVRLGLSIYSPAIGSGSRRLYGRALCASQVPNPNCAGINILSADNLSASPSQPFRMQAGFAWESQGGAISADVIFLAPRSLAYDQGKRVLNVDVSHVVDRQPVVNFSLGAEKILSGMFPLRAGFFTDFSGAPDLQTGALPLGTNQPDKVSRYGVTASIGYRGEHSSLTLGGMLSYGKGDAQNTNEATGLVEKVEATNLLAYFLLASSYEF